MHLKTLARTSTKNDRVLPTPSVLIREEPDLSLEDFIKGCTAVSGGYRTSTHMPEDNDNMYLFGDQDFGELKFD